MTPCSWKHRSLRNLSPDRFPLRCPNANFLNPLSPLCMSTSIVVITLMDLSMKNVSFGNSIPKSINSAIIYFVNTDYFSIVSLSSEHGYHGLPP
jgi:hypothetical protein